MDSLKTRKTVSLFLLGVVIACVAYVSMRPAAARNQTMPLPPLESAARCWWKPAKPAQSRTSVVAKDSEVLADAFAHDNGSIVRLSHVATNPDLMIAESQPLMRHPASPDRLLLAVAMRSQVQSPLPLQTSLLLLQTFAAELMQFVQGWRQMSARWHRMLQDQSALVKALRSRHSVDRVRILAS